jgi:hypothetical protein
MEVGGWAEVLPNSTLNRTPDSVAASLSGTRAASRRCRLTCALPSAST